MENFLSTQIYLWKFNFWMSTFERVSLNFLCSKPIYWIITFLMHITKICTYLCRYIEFIYFSPRHYYFVNLSWICQDHHYIVLQHLSISFSQETENGWNIWCGAMPTAELHCGKFQTHQNVLACNWKKYVYKLLY